MDMINRHCSRDSIKDVCIQARGEGGGREFRDEGRRVLSHDDRFPRQCGNDEMKSF